MDTQYTWPVKTDVRSIHNIFLWRNEKKQKAAIYLDRPLIYLSELQILLKFPQVHIAYKQPVFALLHVFN